ncbi:cyclic nucleotide-binding domain-containing protein [Mesorhizobium sp. LSHC412B00]|uniref:cyclic nucleotide-binding domain-containing protein n=1 Tax=Mesorhizobium sp. LSHC412B00 TaxID=1287285 RepID=UPI003593B24E
MAHAPTSNILIRKLQAISELAQSDIGILGNISIQEKKYKANEDILREGDKPTLSFVVLDGLIGSTKLTGEGKRQISSFFVPGDIPDLHGLHLSVMDCTFTPLLFCSGRHSRPAWFAFVGHGLHFHPSDALSSGLHAARRSSRHLRTALFDNESVLALHCDRRGDLSRVGHQRRKARRLLSYGSHSLRTYCPPSLGRSH